jgi:predicted nucleic acid-binding protein
MNVVDSSGWLEYFVDDTNADFFAPAIEDEANLIVPTISVYEVFKRILVEMGKELALEAVAMMYGGKVIDLTREIALSAAQTSLDFKLPMADSIILATARTENATLWTQDEHFRDMQGVMYVEKRYE